VQIAAIKNLLAGSAIKSFLINLEIKNTKSFTQQPTR
jgi:hypothetical protein